MLIPDLRNLAERKHTRKEKVTNGEIGRVITQMMPENSVEDCFYDVALSAYGDCVLSYLAVGDEARIQAALKNCGGETEGKEVQRLAQETLDRIKREGLRPVTLLGRHLQKEGVFEILQRIWEQDVDYIWPLIDHSGCMHDLLRKDEKGYGLTYVYYVNRGYSVEDDPLPYIRGIKLTPWEILKDKLRKYSPEVVLLRYQRGGVIVHKMEVLLPDRWRAVYIHTESGGIVSLKSPDGFEAHREEWPGEVDVTHYALERWGRNALMKE